MYLWKDPDYHTRWLPAADISMERVAYFAGEKSPYLHVHLGNYWVVRSKTINPAHPDWESAWTKAIWHYKKNLSIESGQERKKMKQKIKHYIWNFYPDEELVHQAVE